MKITRRSFVRTGAGAAVPAALAQTRKPNIVVFLADDLGYGDIGCYGSADVPTPNLDRLAREGTRCTDAYVSCAVCSPSRVALLTGMYQHRFGHEFNSGPPEREAQVGFGIPKDARILPQYLGGAGYRSAVIGKWHLGVRPGYHPLDRGFDEFYGFLTGGNSFITKDTPGARAVAADDSNGQIPAARQAPIYRNRSTVEDPRYLTDAFGDEAVDFIGRSQANPWFLYLAFNAIHTPLHATEAYVKRVASIREPRHRMLAAMTVAMDDAIGRVLTKIRDTGAERDTLVVFLSDNGCPVITGAGTNGPLNGEKCTYFEGGIRVPMILRWPGRIPAGQVYRHPVVSRDLAPTFLKAAGVSTRSSFDGVDLTPFLNSTGGALPHDFLFWRAG